MASSPVPAEGSRTRSAAVMAAAAADREAKRDRRRELLERLALLGAARVGGEKARDLREHRQCGGRRPGFTEKHFAVFAEEQHRRRLAGVVGGFPIPGAGRIGGAEGRLHRGAQDAGVDAATTFEIGKEKPRGLGDGGGCSRKRWRSRTGGRGAGRIRHEGDLGRAGTGRAAGRSLSTRPAQTRPGQPLALVTPPPRRCRVTGSLQRAQQDRLARESCESERPSGQPLAVTRFAQASRLMRVTDPDRAYTGAAADGVWTRSVAKA